MQAAVRHGPARDTLPDDLRIAYCTTCMNRGPQLFVALCVNLALHYRWRETVRFVVALFGDDADVWEAMKTRFAAHLASGYLVVASGGVSGEARCLEPPVQSPPWMPLFPEGGSPDGAAATPPKLHFWHASWAKNSSHLCAVWSAGHLGEVLVNADGDNLIPTQFTSSLAAVFSARKSVPFLCVSTSGCEGALTGRLAYRAKDFVALRGYDTVDTPPAACEDTDLRDRFHTAAAAAAGQKDRPQQQPRLAGPALCGCALPNAWAAGRRHDERHLAKVLCVDPVEIAKYGGDPSKAFARMCELGWATVYAGRRGPEHIIRNQVGRCGGQPWFCAWWTRLGPAVASPSPPPGAAPVAAGDEAGSRPGGDQAGRSFFTPLPPGLSLEPWPPRAPPMEPAVVKVHIIYGGLRFLRNMVDTPATRAGGQTPGRHF